MNKKNVYGVLFIIFLLIVKIIINYNNNIEKGNTTNSTYSSDLFDKNLTIEKSISYNALENNISTKEVDIKNKIIKEEKTIIILNDSTSINKIIETEFIPIINDSILEEHFFFEEDLNNFEINKIESFLFTFTEINESIKSDNKGFYFIKFIKSSKELFFYFVKINF